MIVYQVSKKIPMVPVLINMKNTVAVREAGKHAKFPLLISIVLLLLVFVSSFLMGFGVNPGQRNYVVSLAFVLMTTTTLFLVMKLAPQDRIYQSWKCRANHG